jgi:hypothetical protein
MIYFSDFLLSISPWSFYRFNEPLNVDYYRDSSDNNNHLQLENHLFDNQQTVSYPGEPYITGIRNLSEYCELGINSVISLNKSKSIFIEIPEFKSESFIYRSRQKIQNTLSINSFWIDICLGTEFPSYHEEMKTWIPVSNLEQGIYSKLETIYTTEENDKTLLLTGNNVYSNLFNSCSFTVNETYIEIGSLKLIGTSKVFYDDQGDYLGNSLTIGLIYGTEIIWFKVIKDINDSIDSSLYQKPNRITIGKDGLNLKLSFNGEEPEIIPIHLTEINHVGLGNNITYSNLAIYINKPFPTNEWLLASQKALTRDFKTYQVLESNMFYGTHMINKQPFEVSSILDKILVYGTKQTLIKSISVLGSSFTLNINETIPGITVGSNVEIDGNMNGFFNGLWRIVEIISNSLILLEPVNGQMFLSLLFNSNTYNVTNSTISSESQLIISIHTVNNFSTGEIVTLEYLTQDTQAYQWEVSSVGAGFCVVSLDNLTPNVYFNNDAVMKSIPVGGGWLRTTNEDWIGYKGNNDYFVEANDTDNNVTHLRVKKDTLESEHCYVVKHNKNTLSKNNTVYWKTIGDNKRVYLFLPTKQSAPSQTQLIFFGEVFDWFNSENCISLIANRKSTINNNPGYNLAFQYPDWIIDSSTGYLICRSFQSHDSDIKLDVDNSNLLGFGDSGQHIYPINVPYISYTP